MATENCIPDELVDDWPSTDLRISLFSSAALSFKYETLLRPLPSAYKNSHNEIDVEKVRKLLNQLPRLSQLDRSRYDKEVVKFLQHIFPGNGNSPKLKSLSRSQFLEKYQQENWDLILQKPEPHYIFEVLPSSIQESTWQRVTEGRSTFFAFHGSRLENFHSILNLGLQQHLNKMGIFGEGIYLSTEMSLSLQYSKCGEGWQNSQLGKKLSVLAVCEFVDHPEVIWKNRKCSNGTNIPSKYIVVTNNELVRLRYLFVYKEGAASRPRKIKSWFQNRFFLVIVVYALVLIAIGFSRKMSVK